MAKVLRGNVNDNQLNAGTDKTQVYGLAGNDTLISDNKNDVLLVGGSGSDGLIVMGGNTTLSGGELIPSGNDGGGNSRYTNSTSNTRNFGSGGNRRNNDYSSAPATPNPVQHFYAGDNQVISNYQSGDSIIFNETYLSSDFDDKANLVVKSSTGSLIVENIADKFINLTDAGGNPFLKVYSATRPSVIDGRNLEGFEILNSSDGSDVIYAGDGNSQLWGGNDSASDTLVGGNGKDIFIDGKNQGSDLFLNVSSSDEVHLDDVTLNDLTDVEKNNDMITFSFKTGNSVTIQSSDSESGTIILADTTWHFKHST